MRNPKIYFPDKDREAFTYFLEKEGLTVCAPRGYELFRVHDLQGEYFFAYRGNRGDGRWDPKLFEIYKAFLQHKRRQGHGE